MSVFFLTLQQTGILLIFILIGYFFRKKGMINDGAKKTMSALLVNLFAPAYSITSLSQNLSIDKIAEYGLFLVVSVVLTLFVISFALPFAKILGHDKLHRNILKYALAFGNIGYFGYPVVGAVFGESMKALMILTCIPMSIAINTYGYSVLTEKVFEDNQSIEGVLQKKTWAQKLRFLYAGPFIGTMLGLLLGLLPFTLPKFFVDLASIAGNCQSATAMLLTGAVLANVPLLKLFTTVKPYIVGVVRLVVFPIVVGAICFAVHLFGVNGETFKTIFRLCVIISAMPVGMNVVVYPESCGMNSTEGAKMCFLSYIMALVTMPLIFMLIEAIVVTL